MKTITLFTENQFEEIVGSDMINSLKNLDKIRFGRNVEISTNQRFAGDDSKKLNELIVSEKVKGSFRLHIRLNDEPIKKELS